MGAIGTSTRPRPRPVRAPSAPSLAPRAPVRPICLFATDRDKSVILISIKEQETTTCRQARGKSHSNVMCPMDLDTTVAGKNLSDFV